MSRTVLSAFCVDPFRIGGTEVFSRELSLQLGRRGWQSTLCFLAEPSEAVRSFLDLPNITLDTLDTRQDPSSLSWAAASRFRTLVRRHRPEVVHLHYFGLVSTAPWAARTAGARKVFFTDHGSRAAGRVIRRAPLHKRLAMRIINHPLTGIVAVSDYGLRCLTTQQLLPDSLFRRIYNGVDPALCDRVDTTHSFRTRYGIPESRSLVVQVSWIIPEKGVEDLLAAARLVIQQDPNVHFAIVGEGKYRPEFTRKANEMGLGDHVTWTGIVENPLAEGVYAAADVVCQPSRWEEVFGWVITEAMAFHKPVVATRVGGIPEVVDDRNTGFLVERGDVQALAENILHLIQNPSLRRQMGDQGRKRVEERFDVRKNIAELIDFYGLD